MNKPLDIYYNVTGQSIFYDCPEGRPSSVTSVDVFPIDIGDDGTKESATSGAATIDTPDATALTAAAGPSETNPNSVAVTDASNIDTIDDHGIQRRYLLSENEQREWIEPVEVSGNTLEVRHPLANDYTTSAVVDSTRIIQALDSTWLQDENNIDSRGGPAHYRVRWEYVVDGVTYVRDSYFSLVRYRGDYEVSATDVDLYSPGFMAAIDSGHQRDDAAQLIAEADREVDDDLRHIDIDDAEVRDSLLNGLIVRKVVEIWRRGQMNAGTGDPGTYEIALRDYNTYFSRHFALGDSAQVGNADGAAIDRSTSPLMIK